jgi:hypothetical protein
MKPIVVPTHGVQDWQERLADPTKHWRTGYSARALAHAWEEAAGLPPEIVTLLAPVGKVELLLAIPEYDVPLPGGERPSQNDVFVLARTKEGLVVIMVEGKVFESFGPTLEEWRKEASAGKAERLAHIKAKLGLTNDPPPGTRYQLFHRAASAAIEAERFQARDAAMIVHSFSPQQASLGDYQAFLGLFGKKGGPGQLVQLGTPDGVRLWAGWAQGDPRFLSA